AIARDILLVGAGGLGTIMGAIGAGGLAGAISVANFGSFKRRGLVLICAGIVFAALLVGFGLSRWFALSVGLGFLLGFSQNFFFASANTMIQTNVPAELRGRLISMYAFMMMGFMPLGSMFMGSMSEVIGVGYTV